MTDNHSELLQHFYALYGRPSETPKIFFAPGRVNLIGEHTDYTGGFVLPCAIQSGTRLIIRANPDGLIRFASINRPTRREWRIGEPLAPTAGDWTNYPTGILDQFMRRGIRVTGLDLLFHGDIPEGAGLSSSASIEMVTAYAFAVMLNATELEMIDLIHMSRQAEHEFAGVNCGIMDMFAIGMGKKDYATFLNCHTLEYKRVALELQEYRLVMADTKKSRSLADSKYNERVAECQLATAYLSQVTPVSRLSELGFMQFFKVQEQIPDEVIRRRARHVISENQRVLNAVSVLMRGDIMQFGALMNASHESLRDNYEVSGPELDILVAEAIRVNGCIGARMTGAGFGGCTVNLVRKDSVDEFMAVTGENYRQRTGLIADFYPVIPSAGVQEGIPE